MSKYCLEKCNTANVIIARREPSTFQIKSRGIAQCIQRKNSQKISAIKNSRENFKNSSANFRTQEELQQIQNSIKILTNSITSKLTEEVLPARQVQVGGA
jgi:hypothetical protein